MCSVNFVSVTSVGTEIWLLLIYAKISILKTNLQIPNSNFHINQNFSENQLS